MKDNFDDIVKRKWEHMQFPVDEGHRMDMIQLLDQQKRRRGVFFWWLGGLLVAIVAGSMILLSPAQPDTLDKNVSGAMNEKEESNVSSSATTSASKVEVNDSDSDKENMNEATFDEASQVSDEKVPNANHATSLSKNNTLTNSAATESKINPKLNVDAIKDANTVRTTGQKTTNPIREVQETKPDMTLLSPEQTLEEINDTKINENAIVDPNENVSQVLDDKDVSNSTNEVLVRNIILVVPVEALPVSEVDIKYSALSPVIKTGFTNAHPLAFFAEAGAGYVPPSFPDIKSGWSMKLGGGLHYGLLKSTSLFFSGGYYLQKGGFNFQRTSNAIQPGFGARSIANSLTPDKLHFIYSKLGIEQKFRRHSVTGALCLQWLYGAQGTIDIRAQDQFNQNAVDETKYAWLVLDGMNRMVWSGELEYGYQLAPRWKLSMGLKHYFSRITKDDAALKDEGYYWTGKLSPFNPSFTIQYRIYGK